MGKMIFSSRKMGECHSPLRRLVRKIEKYHSSPRADEAVHG